MERTNTYNSSNKHSALNYKIDDNNNQYEPLRNKAALHKKEISSMKKDVVRNVSNKSIEIIEAET